MVRAPRQYLWAYGQCAKQCNDRNIDAVNPIIILHVYASDLHAASTLAYLLLLLLLVIVSIRLEIDYWFVIGYYEHQRVFSLSPAKRCTVSHRISAKKMMWLCSVRCDRRITYNIIEIIVHDLRSRATARQLAGSPHKILLFMFNLVRNISQFIVFLFVCVHFTLAQLHFRLHQPNEMKHKPFCSPHDAHLSTAVAILRFPRNLTESEIFEKRSSTLTSKILEIINFIP